ncbi:MAG: MoxR family ATPase [Phycisphaerae bacterium]|nr:MoxR family ATPase [Phycisphaerae bacterium]
MATDVKRIGELVAAESAPIRTLIDEVGKVIVGQRYMVERLVIGLLSNGHVLLEGVPGLAKSLAVTTLSRAVQARSRRIQFTPDLLPADLIGTQIYNQRTGEFTVRKGPIFANIVLADEINRAPAKVQSALLEAMQERQVSIGEETFRLEEPFLVLATQNPLEQEGTYPLPEAQVDRFLLKLKIDYPSKAEERTIVDRMSVTHTDGAVNPVIKPEDILRLRAVVDEIYVDDKIRDYIIELVFATRDPAGHGLPEVANLIEVGASPRASIALTLASKAHAFMEGRGYVTPQDVKSIGMDVLRHRVILTYEAEAEEMGPEAVLQKVFDSTRVP